MLRLRRWQRSRQPTRRRQPSCGRATLVAFSPRLSCTARCACKPSAAPFPRPAGASHRGCLQNRRTQRPTLWRCGLAVTGSGYPSQRPTRARRRPRRRWRARGARGGRQGPATRRARVPRRGTGRGGGEGCGRGGRRVRRGVGCGKGRAEAGQTAEGSGADQVEPAGPAPNQGQRLTSTAPRWPVRVCWGVRMGRKSFRVGRANPAPPAPPSAILASSSVTCFWRRAMTVHLRARRLARGPSPLQLALPMPDSCRNADALSANVPPKDSKYSTTALCLRNKHQSRTTSGSVLGISRPRDQRDQSGLQIRRRLTVHLFACPRAQRRLPLHQTTATARRVGLALPTVRTSVLRCASARCTIGGGTPTAALPNVRAEQHLARYRPQDKRRRAAAPNCWAGSHGGRRPAGRAARPCRE